LQLNIWATGLRQIVTMFRVTNNLFTDVEELVRTLPERRAHFVEAIGPVEWWRNYEKPFWRHFVTSVVSVGALGDFFNAFAAGGANALELLFADKGRGIQVKEPRDPRQAIAATFSTWAMFKAVQCFGEPMQDLIRRADKDDLAFFNALRIDPTAIHCAPCRRRLARAALEHDTDFFKAVGGKLANPKLPQSVQYGELEICLRVMHYAKRLQWLNEALATELFLVRLGDLKLFSGKSKSGAPRALIRHIQRRRPDIAT
jgi:hypothetical protein